MQPVRGSGGGKSGGGEARAPVEAPDSLRSRQYARVLDVVSEGEIVGLVDGLKSIYLDDTPIQNPDGSYNFTGVTMVERTGTQSQPYIPGFPAVEAESAVGVEVKAATPVTRTISNQNANAVRVTVSVPQLTSQNPKNGDMSGTAVQIAIDVQTNGGGFVEKVNDTIAGKTTSRYQRAYRIELTGTGPWDVRVRRINADSTTVTLRNATYWDSYTEIIDAKLRYPNSALIALAVDAERFRNIPRRGYEMKGILVQIPSNYDPVTRAYTGVWDGTFKLGWTNNPAWCFYDLVTNERYGLGAFIDESQVDKWTLYKIAQYCDEIVSDGFGGVEPRFTCNLYLQTREEAYKVINSMASIFRGMVYWSGGAITAVQDAPSDPVALFTPANVVSEEGKPPFNYSGSSGKARHTVALVSWNDPADRYRQKIEYVADEEGIRKWGVIQTEIVAVGCTSRGQAHRLGRWLLYTERMETEVVSFRTGLDGLAVAPGEVIQTSDPVRAGVRMGGRIIAATATDLTLDAPVQIESAKTYTLWAVLPDGTVESRAVTTDVSTTANVTVSPAFSAAPQAMAMWVLAASDLTPETWRVVSVAEVDGTQAEITALAYRADKYLAVEQGLILEPLQTSRLNSNPNPPTDFVVSESLYLVTPAVVGTRMTVSWLSNAQHFELQYRRAGGNWTTVTTAASSIDIQPVENGDYEFSLIAINALGKRSQPLSATQTIYGKTALPQGVTGFNLSAIGGMAHLTFDAALDLDVRVGGYLRIRHTPDTVNPQWSNAVDIGSKIPGGATTATLPLLPGSYLAKWIDSDENECAAPAIITTDAPNIMALNAVAALVEQPDFAGQWTNVGRLGNALVLDSVETIGQQTGNVSTWGRLSALGGISPSGEYQFSQIVDLGAAQTARLTAAVASQGFDALDLIDERSDVDSWPSVDGDLIADVGCKLYVSTTSDDPAGTPTWSDWTPFVTGDYTTRAFKFRAVLFSNYPTHNIMVSQLEVRVDMPDRIESGEDIVSGAGTYHVAFSRPFLNIPAVGPTAQDMATGDYCEVTNKTASGFDITFYNAAGTPISRTFDYIAKGY